MRQLRPTKAMVMTYELITKADYLCRLIDLDISEFVKSIEIPGKLNRHHRNNSNEINSLIFNTLQEWETNGTD